MPPAKGQTPTAVIPAAGFGTRLHPLSAAVPKELLPVGSRPMIQWSVEEVINAGIEHIVVVLRKGKETIRSFLTSVNHQAVVGHEPSGRPRKFPCRFRFVYQEEPLGLGDALRVAWEQVGDVPLAMVIPDQLLLTPVGAVAQLLARWSSRPKAIWSSMVWVDEEELQYFQGARAFEVEAQPDGTYLVGAITDPKPKDGRVLLGFGRTVFPPAMASFMTRAYTNPITGEVDLLRTFEEATKDLDHYGVVLEGTPCDFGVLAGYRYYQGKLLTTPGAEA